MSQVVVVDIEATCWRGDPPPGEINEIIEVGVCLLDVQAHTPTAKRGILVKPTRSKVSPFCTRLTTLTQEQVEKGVSFAEACAILERDYHTRSRLWLSWGDYDRKMFRAQCAAFDVPYPFGEQHINLKALFSRTVKFKRELGLMRALRLLDLKPEGTPHRGVDDAYNTARVLVHLLREYGEDVLNP